MPTYGIIWGMKKIAFLSFAMAAFACLGEFTVYNVTAFSPGREDVAAADAISAARPGARRETLETYTSRLKQLEEITNSFKGVSNSFAIQAGREVRVMVVPEQVSDDDMVIMARDIARRIESEMEYPGQIKVNVIRESRATDTAK